MDTGEISKSPDCVCVRVMLPSLFLVSVHFCGWMPNDIFDMSPAATFSRRSFA